MTAVRPMREEDLAAVLAIAACVPTAPHWPEFEWRRLLALCRSEPERRAAWLFAGPGGEARGFAVAACVADAAELESVVVAPAFRRQGIGRTLVQAAIEWADAAGAHRLLLEVRASNHPALKLYAGAGFTHDGRRPGYYRNPDEDAVLLGFVLEPKFQIGNRVNARAHKTP